MENEVGQTNDKKLLFNINKQDLIIENDYCPHIYDHFLNSYMNSKLKKINISHIDTSNNQNIPNTPNNNKNKNIIYLPNLSLLQNSFKSYIYYGYNEAKNILNSFLLKNLSSDYILLNNPQNVSVNSMNKEGCIFSMNFNDTGNLMGATNHHNSIEIWDIKNKKIKKILTSHTEIVTGIDFFHEKEDNESFITCSLDKTIKLWKNYENIHTFLDHSDWVRCISIRNDNTQFLSGCVSSVVKLWDLPTQRVIGTLINQNLDANTLTTINSLSFLNSNPNLFIIGLRSGEVKICDSRIQNKNDEYTKNVGIVQSFKAHKNKLNTVKLNSNDKYILTSGRDSTLRVWDLRNLPEKNEESKNYINEYNKHKCIGYNIECNFYLNENYIMTGSEDGNIYIYDIFNNNIYYKLKTSLKCINLIKQIPHTYNIAFTGLEDISIFVWNSHKNVLKFYEKYCYKQKYGKEDYLYDSENEEDLNDEITDKNSQLTSKLIEEVMTECGDVILKFFHSNNFTYTNGINLERLNEILSRSNDSKTADMLKSITDKFMKKMLENIINVNEVNKKQEKKKTEKKERKKVIKKNAIKCLECTQNKTNNKNSDDNCNNIFNFVDRELLNQLLILPNDYGFNSPS